MSARTPRPLGADAVATVALCGYTLAVAFGFARVFNGWSFMSGLATIAIVGHGVSFLLRRARVSGWIAVPGLVVVLTWLLSVMHYRDTMQSPVPWSATWARVRFDLGLVRDLFPTAVAPVLYEVVGWAVLASIAIAIVVVLSDSFAFRAEARGEALVPGGVLFVFVAALGSERLQIASTVLLIAAGVVAVIALRRLHDRERGAVLRSRRRTALVVPLALGTAFAIALLAGVVGPRLPGAHAEALYDTKGRGGTNFVDSPIVDLHSRLTNQGNVKLFRVDAAEPRYWRSVTLAEFDGRQFKLPDQPLAAVDTSTVPDDREQLRQQIQILSGGSKFVPAAADALQASAEHEDGEEFGVQRPIDTTDLIVREPLEAGDLITVNSYLVATTPDELRAAGVANAPDPIYLELPPGVPDVVYEETERLTAGLPTAFDQAIALQSWFQDPDEFGYSTDIQAGHSSNAIESFLRVRVGYCEQFAGTFAVMARIAGIPSRVAVGYTQGTLEETGWYSVIGKNSHAWPELWFDGVGWVSFEPTPGRGAPGSEGYTGLEPNQDTSGPATTGDGGEAAPLPTTPPTFVVNDPDAVPTTPPPRSAGDGPELGGDLLPPGAFDLGEDGGGTPPPESTSSIAWLPVIISLLITLGLATPWFVRRILRLRRRNRDARDQVTSAWTRARRAAVDAGVAGTVAMTASEWTAATAAKLPVAARPMRSLADIVDRVMFAPADEVDLDRRGSFGDRLSDDCDLWANQVQRIAADTLPTQKRVRRYFTDFA